MHFDHATSHRQWSCRRVEHVDDRLLHSSIQMSTLPEAFNVQSSMSTRGWYQSVVTSRCCFDWSQNSAVQVLASMSSIACCFQFSSFNYYQGTVHSIDTWTRGGVLNVKASTIRVSCCQCLRLSAWYVEGALGSKSSRAEERERVKQCSLSIDQSDLYMVAEQ